jgi:phage tail-like protein
MSIIHGATSITPPQAQTTTTASQTAKAQTLAALREQEKSAAASQDPAPTYLFSVEITGISVGLFTECSGIGAKRKAEPIREGGLNDKVYQVAGPLEFDNITLKRGLTVSRLLLDWFLTGMYDFSVKRVNLSIIQVAPGMNKAATADNTTAGGYGVIKRWNVENAFPVSWKLSDLSVGNTNSVVIESLELAHEGISLSSESGTALTE